jgi:hypothetical protein
MVNSGAAIILVPSPVDPPRMVKPDDSGTGRTKPMRGIHIPMATSNTRVSI